MIKKEIMHARTGGAAAVISKFKGEKKSLLIRDFAVQSGGPNFCFWSCSLWIKHEGETQWKQ